ncbi:MULTISPECIES: ABC transporter substrate-binding protein [unclassified Bradyrhizobium]|uniref:ABC transporter substrate-binding protein n=1 Tax=unclassified Bradyrhizobium TaxID=2631580 RepID=UPI00143DA4BF|nr:MULTISPECIES: ABC transporter substrate-binding protein [unclassified Bradyrhizobium]
MHRREFIGLLAGAAALRPLKARAQQPAGKVTRIGYLGVASVSEGARGAKAFETGLRDLGHLDGKSLVIEYRWANGRHEQLDVLATELVRLPVDVIVAPTTAAAIAARNATATIPIVFATVSAPVELGLVDSLARPGGNITGLAYYISPEIVGKQLQLLQQTGAQISRVAVLSVPFNMGHPPLLAEAKQVAGSLGVQLRIIEVRGPDDFEGAFRTMVEERTAALLVLPDPRLGEHRMALGNLALKSGLPTMFGSREDLAVGCLMAYGAVRFDLIRRAATYVDKIIKGAKPSDLPVEQPTKFELVINLRTAKALGLELPTSLLLSADEVIE